MKCVIQRPPSPHPPHPPPHVRPYTVQIISVVVVGSLSWYWCCWCWRCAGALGNSSSTRSQFRARHCCVRAACVHARTLSTVRARSQPHNQLQLPPLPRPQHTADLTPSVITSPLTCDNVLPCPPDHPPHPPRHNGVPGVRGLQLQGSDGVHSVLFSGPRPGQACGKDGPRTQGPRY